MNNPAPKYPLDRSPEAAAAADCVINAARAYAACWAVGTRDRQWPGQLPPGKEANEKLQELNAALAAYDAIAASLRCDCGEPVNNPPPKCIPVLLMRCGMESPDCEAKMGFVVSLDKVSFGIDLLTAAKAGGFKVVLPKMGADKDSPHMPSIFRTLPMDDFLPNRPQLVAIVCGACAQAARDNKMLDGEIT